MTSRERIINAWEGRGVDHVPLTTWAFGLRVPGELQWKRDGVSRKYWYSLRMEHLHTLPQPWDLEDDFRRVLAWRELGVDDMLDVSVPWSMDPIVKFIDEIVPAGSMDPHYPVMTRTYETPAGHLEHRVRKTGEDPGAGWVVQPDSVPLIEDYNIPRGLKHIVSTPADVAPMRFLYSKPDREARDWFVERVGRVRAFAGKEGVPVQAWAGFGMDAVVWFAGTEGAIMLAMDEPGAFGELFDIITECDLGRVELACSVPGVDMICERGWYSSTDFWSPDLFDQFVFPHVRQLADAAHRGGKKFGYVMTTGVDRLGNRLADAGVDVLYFVDPIQDRVSLENARNHLSDRMTLVGGTNALSLQSGDASRIREEVRRAVDVLASSNRFILHPVDALFPDTPWEGVEAMVEAWKEFR